MRAHHGGQGATRSASLVGARLVTSRWLPRRPAIRLTGRPTGRLCRLLTTGNRRAIKGQCHFSSRRRDRRQQRVRSSSSCRRGRSRRASPSASTRSPAAAARPGLSRRRVRLRRQRSAGASASSTSSAARRARPLVATNDAHYHHSRPEAARRRASPASARSARWRKPAIASRPMPSGISKAARRWRACSRGIRRPSPAR